MKNKLKYALLAATRLFHKKIFLWGVIAVLSLSCVYVNQLYKDVSQELHAAQTSAFRNQYFQGKSCGLLTNKEAAALIGTPVATGGSVIASDSTAGQTHPGEPRIDSCAHSSLKSSDGYVDVIIKDYANKKDAVLSYDQDMAKTFPAESREPGALGEKLSYGGGVYYLLKYTRVIEVSASRTPRTIEPGPEAFSREVLEKVVAKL